MQTYAFFSDYVWLVNINSLFYPSFASFHKLAGRFSNKPCLHRKEALFTSQTSLVWKQKKPCLKTHRKQAIPQRPVGRQARRLRREAPKKVNNPSFSCFYACVLENFITFALTF